MYLTIIVREVYTEYRRSKKTETEMNSESIATHVLVKSGVVYYKPVKTFFKVSIARYIYAKQKHPGCKKRRGQSEAAVIK